MRSGCRSGSRRGTTAKVAGASLPAEAITLTFENETRYEATFARGSPVGFVAAEQRFSHGIPGSWDEIKLELEE